MFKNAQASRDILEENGEKWDVNLSRKKRPREKPRKPYLVRAKETTREMIRLIDDGPLNTAQYEGLVKKIEDSIYDFYKKKEKKLTENNFGKTNCKKCGSYKNIKNSADLYSLKTCLRSIQKELALIEAGVWQGHRDLHRYDNSIVNTYKKLVCQCHLIN
jgi:excinuclease UvrABC ATPase subunit